MGHENPLYIVRINPDKQCNMNNKNAYQHNDCTTVGKYLALEKVCRVQGKGFHEYKNFFSEKNGFIHGYLPPRNKGNISGYLKDISVNDSFDVIFITYTNKSGDVPHNKEYDERIVGIQLNCKYLKETPRNECQGWLFPKKLRDVGYTNPIYNYVCDKEISFLLNNAILYNGTKDFLKYVTYCKNWGSIFPSLKIDHKESFLKNYFFKIIKAFLSEQDFKKIVTYFEQNENVKSYTSRCDITLYETIKILSSSEQTEIRREIWMRQHQGDYRKGLLAKLENSCCVSGCNVKEVIRASHIKPWKDCTNSERLNTNNGLPLIGTLDLAFDKHLISFNDEGAMIFSPRLSGKKKTIKILKQYVSGLNWGLYKGRNSDKQKLLSFLKEHREETLKQK